MSSLNRVAPIFAVRDLDAAVAHYRRMGFEVRTWRGGGYAFATWDKVEIHLGAVPDDNRRHPASAYVWVDDADQLAQAWSAAGVTVHPPEDTEWGQHEGVAVDPDGNVIRFGSPVRSS